MIIAVNGTTIQVHMRVLWRRWKRITVVFEIVQAFFLFHFRQHWRVTSTRGYSRSRFDIGLSGIIATIIIAAVSVFSIAIRAILPTCLSRIESWTNTDAVEKMESHVLTSAFLSTHLLQVDRRSGRKYEETRSASRQEPLKRVYKESQGL